MERRGFFRCLLGLAALPLVPLKAVAPAAAKAALDSASFLWDYSGGSVYSYRISSVWSDELEKPTVLGHLSTLAGKVDEAAEEVARWEHLMGLGCNVAEKAVTAVTKAASTVIDTVEQTTTDC